MSATNAVQLVVFDWAGTTIDFGSRAPTAAFCRLFAAHGVEVSEAEARAPMGLNKREHLLRMFAEPALAARWQAVHGRSWNEQDIDTMYHEFMPIQLETIQRHSELVPGLLGAVSRLRDNGVKIGATTGYFTEAANTVVSSAAAAGFTVDANFCADDVPQGRPAPWMIFRVMERLGVYPPAAVVNVGDTVADIHAGLAAGCWSVGVCDSSSVTGLSAADFARLSAAERTERITAAAAVFRRAGCHATIDTMSDLPNLIAQLTGTPRRLEA